MCKDGDAQGTCVKHFLICSDINVSSFNMNILGHFSTALFWKELLLVTKNNPVQEGFAFLVHDLQLD